VFNWLFARHHGGQFILRIEDTDLERSRPEYTQNILDGLRWLGMNWDEGPIFQSQRLHLYRQKIQELLDQGLAYRCYCTESELAQMREEQKAKKQAPRYDNRHRNLTPEQRAAFEAEGRTSVIRFIIDDEREIAWNDLVRDRVSWKGSDLGGDMVIARAATGSDIGQPLYNFVVVVDDIDMAITHVIRGEDHIGNTPKQILLYEAFGAKTPDFGHTPLILNQAGQKLSKRDGVTSISDFQQLGYTAEAMANYMTLLGWSPPDSQELFSLEEAAAKFGFERVNKAGAKFDWDKLNWINSQYLHSMPVDKLTETLIPYWREAGCEFDPAADRPWLEQLAALIGPSLSRLKDAADMSRVFFCQRGGVQRGSCSTAGATGSFRDSGGNFGQPRQRTGSHASRCGGSHQKGDEREKSQKRSRDALAASRTHRRSARPRSGTILVAAAPALFGQIPLASGSGALRGKRQR
jgi:glutamyl-tRNA synthetase